MYIRKIYVSFVVNHIFTQVVERSHIVRKSDIKIYIDICICSIVAITFLVNSHLQIIYICRNPKASVPSLYKFLKCFNQPPAPSLREYFELFLKGYEGGRSKCKFIPSQYLCGHFIY